MAFPVEDRPAAEGSAEPQSGRSAGASPPWLIRLYNPLYAPSSNSFLSPFLHYAKRPVALGDQEARGLRSMLFPFRGLRVTCLHGRAATKFLILNLFFIEILALCRGLKKKLALL